MIAAGQDRALRRSLSESPVGREIRMQGVLNSWRSLLESPGDDEAAGDFGGYNGYAHW